MAQSVTKGIILAGGYGHRLYPASKAASKQLLTVYDKPMIYYPLATLMDMKITDFMVVANSYDDDRFRQLLGDGSQLGIRIEYRVESEPKGIAGVFLIAGDFIGDGPVALVLGDNIFCDSVAVAQGAQQFKSGALTFGARVTDPQEYGVAEVDDSGRVLSIEEKPRSPRSDIAVTGLYLYDAGVVDVARGIKPSARGELEITDVNMVYLKKNLLELVLLDSAAMWFDAGTADSISRASNYILSIETSSHKKIGCIEETAYLNGLITQTQLGNLVRSMPPCSYRDYLSGLL